MFGVMKAGRLGPMRVSFMPRYSNDSKMATTKKLKPKTKINGKFESIIYQTVLRI